MKRAIVIGGNHHNTLGLIRSLGKEGISSFVILINKVQENCYVLKSKYVSGSAIVEGEEELMELLFRIKDCQRKQVLICTSDRAASIIDKNRKVLEYDYYLPGCSIEGRLTEYMDKEKMAELARQVGLRTPQNITLERDNTNMAGVVYPCIIKPSKSIDGSKMDIAICQNDAELQDHIEKCKANILRVEEFISKTEEYQLIGVAVGGGIIIPGKSIIISQPIFTNTGFLKYIPLDGSEPIEQCLQFIRKVGYEGLFSMEFIRDRNGNDYFMEINFRNDGNSICVTAAGCNLPYIWYAYNETEEGKKISSLVPQSIRPLYVMPEYDEINLWYSHRITFSRMLKEFRLANVYMEYDKNDPAPTNGRKDFIAKFCKAMIKKPIKRALVALNLK